MNHAGITSMTRYFGKNRGKAISVGNLGGMTGVMFLPFLIVYLSDYFSFKQIWLFCGLGYYFFYQYCFIFLMINLKDRKNLNIL